MLWFVAVYSPLFNEEGEIYRIISSSVSIDEQVEKEIWMITKDKLVIDFNVTEKTLGFFGRKTSSYKNFVINQPKINTTIAPSKFSNPVLSCCPILTKACIVISVQFKIVSIKTDSLPALS